MKRRILSLLMILALLVVIVPMNDGVYADAIERTITLDNYKVFKGNIEDVEKRISKLNDLTIIKKKGEKAVSKCVGKIDETFMKTGFKYDIESKFSYGLQEIIVKKRTKENTKKYEFIIYSNFSSPVEDVIEALKNEPFRVEVQKRTFDSLTTKLSLNEITRLANLKEIRKICLISETKGVVDVANVENDDNRIKLNASTEMLGVEKAR